MDKVRLGVIGLGNIGQQHIRHILSDEVNGCEIAALCARSPNPLAQELDVPQFTDYQDLVDSGGCDAVLVATPTFSHSSIGSYALDKGLHLLMEKPIGLSVGEGESLLAQSRPETKFGLMLNQRLDPVYSQMKTVIEEGLIGPIQRCSWIMTNWFRPEVYFQVSDWRATWRGEGGGLLVNQCIHNLDIYQWLCGMPQRITGFCGFGKYHDIEVEDEASAHFEFLGGAVGSFVGSTGEAPGVNQFDIVGDMGMLSYNGSRLTLTRNNPGTAEFNRETRDMFGQPQAQTEDLTPAGTVNQHALIIQNFIDAIREDAALIAPAREGLNSLAIANGILLSAWQGATIKLPLDSAAYQSELDQRISGSSLREKADIDVSIDMDKSYR